MLVIGIAALRKCCMCHSKICWLEGLVDIVLPCTEGDGIGVEAYAQRRASQNERMSYFVRANTRQVDDRYEA